jgi:hypothetical protein
MKSVPSTDTFTARRALALLNFTGADQKLETKKWEIRMQPLLEIA